MDGVEVLNELIFVMLYHKTFTIHKTVRTMPLNGIGERVFNVVLSSRNHAAKELPKIQQAKSVYKGLNPFSDTNLDLRSIYVLIRLLLQATHLLHHII